MSPETKIYEEKMKKTVARLSGDYSAIRAGRANPAVLDKIRVDYYGTPTAINAMAAVSVQDARVLVISPWDASTLKNIVRAINESDIGINPNNDGKVIRLEFPALTEERRKDLTKNIKKYAEEAKTAIRGVRREALETFKAQKKKSEITEDDLKDLEKDMDKLTEKYVKEVDAESSNKEKEIMTV
ncbi:MAG: ribosome recycling factor [Ruminococcus sp.]|jgi:ribosome recycling factor|nr:ribosome recycling factor [Ruminococcus sp.]